LTLKAISFLLNNLKLIKNFMMLEE